MELSIKVNTLQEVGHATNFPSFQKIGRLDINGLTYRVDYHNAQPAVHRDANPSYFSRMKEFCQTAWADKSLFSHRTTRITQMLPHKVALSNQGQGEPIRCALYGGTDIRGEMKTALSALGVDKDIKLETIDEYNSALGIAWPLIGDSYFSTQQRAATGSLSDHIKPQELENLANGYPDQYPQDQKVARQRESVTQWAEFLHAHHDRIDILGKLKDRIEKSNNSAEEEIESFLAKNVDPNLLAFSVKPNSKERTALVQDIKDFLTLTMAEQQAKLKEDTDLSYLVPKMLNTAFFRQTSKLGLEFFQSTGAKVAFAWQDFSGKEMNNTVLDEKPWKEGRARDNNYSEPITYSEMRHVQRHPELDVTRFKVTK